MISLSVNIEVIRSVQSKEFDGKFHIGKTNSTIEVLPGDIADVPVDLMVCIKTSNTLRESVLRRAGAQLTAQYKNNQQSNDAILLDGGATAAKKILFVPWKTDLQQNDLTKIQKVFALLSRSPAGEDLRPVPRRSGGMGHRSSEGEELSIDLLSSGKGEDEEKEEGIESLRNSRLARAS